MNRLLLIIVACLTIASVAFVLQSLYYTSHRDEPLHIRHSIVPIKHLNLENKTSTSRIPSTSAVLTDAPVIKRNQDHVEPVFSFYIDYDYEKYAFYKQCQSLYYISLIDALQHHKWRTSSMQGASIVIPAIETTQDAHWPVYEGKHLNYPAPFNLSHDFCFESNQKYLLDVYQEKYAQLSSKQRVLLFDLHPTDTRLIDLAVSSNALVAKNSATIQPNLATDNKQVTYFENKVISFPASAIQAFAGKVDVLKKRHVLLSFTGKDNTYDSFRRKVRSLLRNHTDVKVRVYSAKYRSSSYRDEKNLNNYIQEMLASQFCLVPRGDKLYSYRLLETLSAGCVPVVLADGYVLPFSELLDWDRFSLHVPEKDAGRLPEILRLISEQQVVAMRRKAVEVWQDFFASPVLQVTAVLEICRAILQDGQLEEQLK